MKAKTFEKKLSLNKKTIAHLETREQRVVKAGDLPYETDETCDTCYHTCVTCPGQRTCPLTGIPICYACGIEH